MTDSEQVDFDSYQRTQFPLKGLPVPELVTALAALPAGSRVIQMDTRRKVGCLSRLARTPECEPGAGSISCSVAP